jgi:methylenetetrahydrofolate reductase (NADPH)
MQLRVSCSPALAIENPRLGPEVAERRVFSSPKAQNHPMLCGPTVIMHISDILAQQKPSLSFEFFPPRTVAGAEELFSTILELEPFHPSFVSVTYGAGGTTREMTHDLVVRIKRTTGIPPVPHLTCVGHSRDDIRQILERYAQEGVSNILALRGDPPRDWPNYDWSDCDFRHASDLVSFIREFNESGVHPDKRGFGIGVAGFPEGHPAMPNRVKEMDFLKAKVDAGADYICTQLFFDNHDFLDFRERCRLAGIEVPIIAGIMPVTSLSSMARMAELAAGARFPAKLLKALARAEKDPAAVEKVGIHYAAQQCAELLDHGVDGIHFYTLNKSRATREIYQSLGLAPSQS